MTLSWPHQAKLDTSSFEAIASPLLRETLSLARLHLMTKVAREPARSWLRRDYARRWFQAYNSLCPWIEGKYQFTQLVRQLGYLAPDSVLVSPADGMHGDLEAVQNLDTKSEARFCKPLFDSFGRGLHVAWTPEQALLLARRQGRPYLVQSFLPPTKEEWRYVLHRTPEDMRARRLPSIRTAAIKLGPVVVGDGVHTVRELIALRKTWPIEDRRKLLMAASTDIPGPGEKVELVNSGNVSRKLHGFAIPDDDALKRIDNFMLKFLGAFEEHIQGQFGTFCVDLGITADGPVFYELQFPFGNPYGRPLALSGTGSQHAAARSKLIKSMHLSGQVV